MSIGTINLKNAMHVTNHIFPERQRNIADGQKTEGIFKMNLPKKTRKR